MRLWIIPLTLLSGLALFLVACQTSVSSAAKSRIEAWEREMGPVGGKVTALQLLQETGLKQSFLPPGRYARKVFRPIKSLQYVTIHSTQNTSPSADAWQHARALANGALKGGRIGYLGWHFTTQDTLTVQHLPTGEQGDHADFDGPGNNHSVGIEMCENAGNNRARTIDRCAKLAAFLCYSKGLNPRRAVVPHYHWPRKQYNPPNKNCPHFLLENGRPGHTWDWFVRRVEAHYGRITGGPSPQI